MSERPSPEFPNGKFPPGLGFAGPTHHFPSIKEADERRRARREHIAIGALCFCGGLFFGTLLLVFL